MYFVSEQTVIDLVSQTAVTDAIEKAYASLARCDAVNFPVVREALGYSDAIFGFKSGFNRANPVLGVKAGGFWPGNKAKGLPNHQSTIVLFDADTGGPFAFVCGTFLTALRTAAASAVSIKHLAGKGAETLGVLGAGGQAYYQIKAALDQRIFKSIAISDRSEEAAHALVARLRNEGVQAEQLTAKDMALKSDVIITVTPSFQAVIKDDWVRPGAHVACMGADTKGKQEVETALLGRAVIFGDEADQAVRIGECQHAYNENLLKKSDIVTIGKVVNGDHPGRQNDEEITLFDSTGVGLQDLAAAKLALEIAIDHNRALILDPHS